MPTQIWDALTAPEFVRGGIIGLIVLVLVGVFAVSTRDRSTAVGGPYAMASAIALWSLGLVDRPTLGALLVLTAGGFMLGHPNANRAIGGALVAVSGAVTALAMPAPVGWVPWLVGGVAVAGTFLARRTDDSDGAGLTPLLLAITLAGIYVDVPDTELPLTLLGAGAATLWLGLPPVRARLGGGGTAAAVGLVCVATTVGGVGRPASIIGGLACLGVLLLHPLAVRLTGKKAPKWTVVLIHVVVVALASRVAGHQTDGVTAALISILTLAGGLGALVAATRTKTGQSGERLRTQR